MSEELKDLMKSALADYEAAGVDGTEGARAMRQGLARIEELEAELERARNEALEEVAVNLRTYAPHLEDGPEHDVGYFLGYHTALNRIRAMMEEQDDD